MQQLSEVQGHVTDQQLVTDFLANYDAASLLTFLAGRGLDASTFRKLAAAFAEQVLSLADDDRCRTAVDVAFEFAEGRVSASDLDAARVAATDAFRLSASASQAMARIACVDATSVTKIAVAPAQAAHSAAARAACIANLTKGTGAVDSYCTSIIRDVVGDDVLLRCIQPSEPQRMAR